DARRHLVYEIVLMDIGESAIALKKIEVLDANGDAVLATLEGEALAKILRLTGSGKGTALAAGGSGVLFMDVTLAEDAMVPRALKHRFQVAVSKPEGKPSSGNDHDPTPQPPQTQSFIGAPLDVGKPAVAIADDRPEQVPGKLRQGMPLQAALGNHVVIDIGEGRFAFYAHMQPGSLRVKTGDKVTTGEVLGLLGNSGNTDAPHLHFHVMDGASPLLSDGLPYAFTSFTGEGRVTDEQPLFSGGAAPIDPNALSGPHKNQLPLNLQVIGFPN